MSNTPNARKAAARRYQREHPGTTYPEALRQVTADIVVHIPACDHNSITAGLREITRALQVRALTVPVTANATEISGGFAGLGGVDGYGEDWANDTFIMRPYDDFVECSCGQMDRIEQWLQTHPHTPECTQTEIQLLEENHTGDRLREKLEQLKSRLGIPDEGARWHCTCGVEDIYQQMKKEHSPQCELVLPNFVYRPTGAEIRWYKYIGREMTITGDLPADFAAQCLASLG
ncbi:hypothetical protein KL864_33985 [Mycolicibacterium goodii]|uniref:hypothetical protein n=1 Tax=Mycolicibacterium goodii TaxID=134601 RepID=UPI001BDD6999|nr:hypothetical protein [Mycolicibacterium goodii]MBU8820878.1 hypothetical protein [Mycolicibacterium goodii]